MEGREKQILASCFHFRKVADFQILQGNVVPSCLLFLPIVSLFICFSKHISFNGLEMCHRLTISFHVIIGLVRGKPGVHLEHDYLLVFYKAMKFGVNSICISTWFIFSKCLPVEHYYIYLKTKVSVIFSLKISFIFLC